MSIFGHCEKNINTQINEELFKYPEMPLQDIKIDIRRSILEFIFSDNNFHLPIKILEFSAFYFQNNYGEDRFDFDKEQRLFLL
ncbi:hypothetical protein [Listeria sp. PSOL-1]|uniref:hypothetical protein n=1 Tax=Listeria sp. PSOL-1 TaxID=1844999 RepID=UPI001E43D685|nr:hypothetical protein [Listeria sp. PSOL-1]